MSTAHNGSYCSAKDKMILQESEARALAGRMGFQAYACKECGGWHVAHKQNPQQRKMRHATAIRSAHKVRKPKGGGNRRRWV